MRPLAPLLLALLAAPLPALAAERGVEEADALLAAGDFERAKEVLDRALDADLGDEDLVAIHERLGLVELYLGREAAAERSFHRILLSKPDYELPPGTAKKVRELFARVKKRFRPVRIAARVPEEAEAGAPLLVPVEIENLPPGGSPRLYYKRPADEAFRWTALEGREGRFEATVSGAAVEGAGALDLYVEVVDDKARRMAGEGSALAPKRVRLVGGAAAPPEAVAGTAPPPAGSPDAWYESPVAWVIGGAALVGGGVLAYYALSDEPTGTLPVRVVVR